MTALPLKMIWKKPFGCSFNVCHKKHERKGGQCFSHWYSVATPLALLIWNRTCRILMRWIWSFGFVCRTHHLSIDIFGYKFIQAFYVFANVNNELSFNLSGLPLWRCLFPRCCLYLCFWLLHLPSAKTAKAQKKGSNLGRSDDESWVSACFYCENENFHNIDQWRMKKNIVVYIVVFHYKQNFKWHVEFYWKGVFFILSYLNKCIFDILWVPFCSSFFCSSFGSETRADQTRQAKARASSPTKTNDG